jgi:hypothetical protein
MSLQCTHIIWLRVSCNLAVIGAYKLYGVHDDMYTSWWQLFAMKFTEALCDNMQQQLQYMRVCKPRLLNALSLLLLLLCFAVV